MSERNFVTVSWGYSISALKSSNVPLLQAGRMEEVMAGARRKDFHGISFKRRGSSLRRFESRLDIAELSARVSKISQETKSQEKTQYVSEIDNFLISLEIHGRIYHLGGYRSTILQRL